ncbi:histidine phosphatase family protein [uncultured Algibacter sp.]|uniref:SixA phosphatase family protein n=1 Tax=uncultured Algibacter sp. TaxID=298659 RepID=UPI00321753AB
MKNLILVRHAKSSWKYNVIDHERPLNDRGIEDANLISNYVAKQKIVVDKLMSSDAKRAKTTSDIFITNLNIDKSIVQLNHELYDFSGENLINVIKNCDNSINNLMIFGHNHAITAFVNTFGDKDIDNVPTCGFVIIEFNTDYWEDLKQGKTLKTIFPRDLK